MTARACRLYAVLMREEYERRRWPAYYITFLRAQGNLHDRLCPYRRARLMFDSIMHIGPYQSAVYKCDDCGNHYNVNGAVGWEPPSPVWLEPYSEEYCQWCFPKHPDAVPLFYRIEAQS